MSIHESIIDVEWKNLKSSEIQKMFMNKERTNRTKNKEELKNEYVLRKEQKSMMHSKGNVDERETKSVNKEITNESEYIKTGKSTTDVMETEDDFIVEADESFIRRHQVKKYSKPKENVLMKESIRDETSGAPDEGTLQEDSPVRMTRHNIKSLKKKLFDRDGSNQVCKATQSRPKRGRLGRNGKKEVSEIKGW